jgi:hypothetical protein
MAFRFGPGPILDSFPGAQAAYSLRKMSSAYTGSCLTVRRSSDNATTNIGFYRYTIDTDAILRFVGTGSGFVTTWFDQSGNGVNLVQASAGSQFNIATSGSLHYEGNDVVMNAATNRIMYRNTDTVTAFTNWTIYIKGRTTNGFAMYVNGGFNTTGLMQHSGAGGLGYYNGTTYNPIAGGGGSYSTAYRKVQASRSQTTNIRGFVNGINLGNANVADSTLNIRGGSNLYGQVFGNFAGQGWTGTAREAIIYPVTHNDLTVLQINNMM